MLPKKIPKTQYKLRLTKGSGKVILSFIIEMLIFDTNGMAIVNKSFHAPTKIIFPLDLLENGIFDANNFAVLSLGDIVIPGIFMAFLLRFDQSLKRKINIYFNASFLAYLLGLLAIVIEMCIYKTTQPTLSLLILVSCITSLLALIFGDFKALFR
ncbi:Peptidase A22B, signal peptide peptidase [Cinara cedri]|uniref:Peptidase A22B, signal peptide peptidase n=1 Tax=Cinara cedri TaxID=506608 RepID=A0A5E4MJY8_9HEMI|nr:Peptidase A22B, signal peptide peptidase [Cinara cedri]